MLLHKPSAPPHDDAPVLVLGTPEDKLVPIADVRDTASRYGAPLIEFSDMGHDLMLDQGWQKPATRMIDWLNESVKVTNQAGDPA